MPLSTLFSPVQQQLWQGVALRSHCCEIALHLSSTDDLLISEYKPYCFQEKAEELLEGYSDIMTEDYQGRMAAKMVRPCR